MARGQSNSVSDDKGRVEAYAKLADKGSIFLLVPGKRLKELARARFGNRTNVFYNLGARHADAVISNRNGAGIFIIGNPNFVIGIVLIESIIGESGKTQPVDGV